MEAAGRGQLVAALRPFHGLRLMSMDVQGMLQHVVLRLCNAYAEQHWTVDKRMEDLEYLLPYLARMLAREQQQR